MNKINIVVNGKTYSVKVFTTDEEKEVGLQGTRLLAKDSGALFVYDEPQTLGFWMQDCNLNLDIIFINEDWEVLSVKEGKPNSEDILEEDDAMYVLELNVNSGIKAGDEVDLSNLEEDEDVEYEEEDSSPSMMVIGPRGNVQGELKGGERIFSRKHTRTLIKLSKKAYKNKSDLDYKRLGGKVFDYIKTQDNQDPEYVELKN